jgi:hypothetical protein
VFALLFATAACGGDALPRFEDYPAVPIVAGTPAKVNLASHPDAKKFRTALTQPFTPQQRFAGHYRIVEIGCGTGCQSIFAVDLVDGSVFSLFTASGGVVYRPDSRLIVRNDPQTYYDMLETMSVEDVEPLMALYGRPEFWLERAGKFERIGPKELRIDPVSKRIVAK